MSEAVAQNLAGQGVSEATTLQGRARLKRGWANFGLEFLFWWTKYYPRMVLWTRPFFLWFAWRTSTALRDGTTANARRLLGPGATDSACMALAKRIISNLYLSVYELGESCRLTVHQLREHIDRVDGKENYFAARGLRKGAILVTAHIGSFEMGVAALPDEDRRIHLVFRRDEYPRFEDLRSQLREQLGIVEAPVDLGWPMWVRLRDALLADEIVMIQGDRVMPGQRGMKVPFLGGHIQMPTGPIKLALATGAPLIPVFCIRTAVHRVRVVIEPPIHMNTHLDNGGLDSVHSSLLQLAGAIERQVAAHPDQWLMVERMWCEDAIDTP